MLITTANCNLRWLNSAPGKKIFFVNVVISIMTSRKTRSIREEATKIIQAIENSDDEFTSDSEFEESDE